MAGELVPSHLVHLLERRSSLPGHPPCVVVVVVWVSARGAASSPAPEILNAGPNKLHLVGSAFIGDGQEASRIPFLPLLPRQAVEVLEGQGKAAARRLNGQAPEPGETPDPKGAESLGVGVVYFWE